MRYFRRTWEDSPWQHDEWGPSVWYFEVTSDGCIKRQLEVYETGPTLAYDESHIDDDYGGLGDQPLDMSDFASYEITEAEFVDSWLGRRPKNRATWPPE